TRRIADALPKKRGRRKILAIHGYDGCDAVEAELFEAAPIMAIGVDTWRLRFRHFASKRNCPAGAYAASIGVLNLDDQIGKRDGFLPDIEIVIIKDIIGDACDR